MRTIIVRLAELEQTGGSLHGVVEIPGGRSEPFSGSTDLLELITATLSEPAPDPAGRDAGGAEHR